MKKKRSAMHLLLPVLLLMALPSSSSAQLSPSFYASSCPSAASTVSTTVLARAKQDNVVAPSTLRLILHDCFVEGCDASILLDSTPGNQAEREATENKDLPQNAFNAIIEAKKAVEAVCPGVVSCADILVLATRDLVGFLGGPIWEVALGRLDGTVSTASSTQGKLPGPNFSLKQLVDNFGAVGLSLEDMVILSGAHTVGFSHCNQFQNRLYGFSTDSKVDPSINPSFVQQLQQKCPQGSSSNGIVAFDQLSPFTFDSNYYKDLQAGKGLLFSDQVLFQDNSTRELVNSLAASQSQFFSSFTQAMIKMTSIGVKTGSQGEVRKDCSVVNPANSKQPPAVTGSKSPPPAAPLIQASPPPAVTTSPPPVPVATLPPPPPPVVQTPSLPPPQVVQPSPRPVLQPPSPPASPPPRVIQPPSPPAFPPPVVQPSPSLPPVRRNPAPFNPTPNPAPSDPNPGFTIPGIPGISPPITIPRFRIPGFGNPSPPGSSSSSTPPSSSTSSSKSPSSSSP